MAKNFNQTGYSTKEAAQILGMSYHTVLNKVNAGKIKAIIRPEVNPGGRRGIRISRQALADYIWSGDWTVDDGIKEQFEKYRTQKTTVISEPIRDPLSYPVPPELPGCYRANDISELPGCYRANDISELTGAWAVPKEVNLEDSDKKAVEAIPKTASLDEASFTSDDICRIEIDGRIAVGNIGTETARTIINALLDDSHVKFNAITLRRGGDK